MTHPLIIATACADPDVARDLVAFDLIAAETRDFRDRLASVCVSVFIESTPVDGSGK